MNQEQRKLFAKGLIELANLIAVALVFGQFASGAPMNFAVMAFGLITAFALYLGGYWFSRGDMSTSVK